MPRKLGMGRAARPLMKTEIEKAQKMSRSGAEAARILDISMMTYIKYAKIYGIHEQHKNPSGKGIPKIRTKGTIPIKDILSNKYLNYNRKLLKERLIFAGILVPQCDICGYKTPRTSDGKYPLQLKFVDQNNINFNLQNLRLRCYNCAFLTELENNESAKYKTHIVLPANINLNQSISDDIQSVHNLTDFDMQTFQKELFNQINNPSPT